MTEQAPTTECEPREDSSPLDPGGSEPACRKYVGPPDSGAWLAVEFRAACATPPAELIDLLFSLTPESWMRRVPGRETFAWPGEDARIVKRFRGGERRDYWRDRLSGRRRSAARREVENQRELAADGFRVPRPLAWVEEDCARGHPRQLGRSALVMERVTYSATLLDRLAGATTADRGRLLRELVRWVSGFHAAGWIHRDLYLQHIVVVGGEEELYLLDVGRARKRASRRNAGEPQRTRWLVKDLAALQFSAPASVSKPERLRFLFRWLADRGVSQRTERRRFALRILRRARRMELHRPLHLDPTDAMDARFLERES